MKAAVAATSSLVALGASTASAFVTPNTIRSPSTHSSSKQMKMVAEGQMSKSTPFLPRNPVLDTVPLAGDVGFDPLNLAKDKETLLFYRDAEQKHGRLSMLAALGWVTAELFDGRLAAAIGAQDLLVRPDADGIGLSPSLLNGGLTSIPVAYWLLVLGLTGALEVQFQQATQSIVDAGKEPGDYSFDPLGLYPKDKAGQELMREREIKHGRLGMIAVVAFAFQEFVSRVPVVEETPALFGLTANERIAEAQVGEVAAESFSVLNYLLHSLHLL